MAGLPGSAVAASAQNPIKWGLCSALGHGGCADASSVYGNVGYKGAYIGQDEPSMLFYSNKAGSGNNDTYLIRLPKDPPVAPNQSGTGGTDNFQLYTPGFWVGMALCDSQSFPEFTTTCAPDTNANIFNSPDPASPHFIGKHPGTAFMEMTFYPPGWVAWPTGNSCAATEWCAAINIDSMSLNPAGQLNNTACQSQVGTENVNFAFITKNGTATGPANPLDATGATYTPDPQRDLFMRSGDLLSVHLFDTPAGLRIDINDLSARVSGSMTASIANGFAQVNYQPTATTCTVTPYAYHPMYSTSSPDTTRVPWAAHSYNVAFSDELGHFEYCGAADPATLSCTSPGVSEQNGTLDNDDIGCFSAAQSSLVQVTGCVFDNDWDGTTYLNDWPGTGSQAHQAQFDPQPLVFTSPLFNGFQRYSQIAFENDLPRIEIPALGGPGPYCNQTTGVNCVDPPPGAQFYPFYTTSGVGPACVWRIGGPNLPRTTLTFGGTPTTAYGGLLKLSYPTVVNGQPASTSVFNDFRQILPSNPC
jgi:hypothetical protein